MTAYQERLWQALDREEPQPIRDWLIFDGWEPEIEEEYGTTHLSDDTCRDVVRRVTGLEPVDAHFDQYMNGIEYFIQEEVDDEYDSY